MMAQPPRKRPPEDADDTPRWYRHFDAMLGGWGWVVGLAIAFGIFTIVTEPEKAGRSIGAFFGNMSRSYHEAADPKPPVVESKPTTADPK